MMLPAWGDHRMKDINIVNYLTAHACSFPDKHCFSIISSEGNTTRKVTYKELETSVKQVAFLLMSRRLKDKTVLLVYQDMLAFIISFLACEYAGIIPVPVPYGNGSKQRIRINGIITDAQTDTILCTEATVNHLRAEFGDTQLQFITTDEYVPMDEEALNITPTYTDISFIQYTSGSVGNPKGVVVTANNLLHNQQLIQQTFGCDENSVIFSWLPFHHDMGLIGNVLHTIYVGCSCVLMSPLHFIQKPKAWLKGITEYKVTHSGAPNFAYDLCVERIPSDELASIDLSSWKVAFNGSEPVHAATMERFIRHFKSVGFNADAFTPCYGLAEATLLVAGVKNGAAPLTVYIDKEASAQGKLLLADPQHDGARAVVSSGYPADGMQVKIISSQGQHECGELEEGEICISGQSVTRGYWNKENHDLFYEYAGEKFLRTGDLGFLYNDALFVHGRVKEMLIIRGKNYYPYDIEQMVFGCNDAIELNGVAVFSLDDDAAIVVVAEIKRAYVHNINGETIIAVIDKLITGELGIAPYDIILTTPLGIPRTTSGKLQRIKCKAYYHDKAFNIVASKGGMADKLLKKDRNPLLLKQVITNADYDSIRAYVTDMIEAKGDQLPPAFSDETDLTALGVDSLRAMEMINTINRELSIHLDATKIYQHNTLSALCNSIDALLWLNTETTQTFGKEITI